MSNDTTPHTPADVRERAVRLLGLAMERAELLCRDAGRAEWPLSDFGRDMLQSRLDTVRDLIGDALAALRSEAPGEDRWEDVVFGPITEAYNEAHAAHRDGAQAEVWREVDDLLARLERFEYDAAGESEEYWRVVTIRDRIAAARRSEGGGE